MRFVLGLIVGVAVVLIVATLLAPATAEVAASAEATAAAAVVGGVAATSAAEDAAEPETAVPDVVATEAELQSADAAPTPTGLSASVTAAEPPVAVGESGLMVEATVPDAVTDAVVPAAPPSVAEASLEVAAPEPASAVAGDNGRLVDGDPEAGGGQLSVWRPFHSEASAEGFARRLSSQLGYPFTVQRVAAAEYHVVFDYADGSERELLSRQIAALTGRQP
ncbi:MAG: hypothetical protein AAGG11_14550 [Pseudomonadota bacterium]